MYFIESLLQVTEIVREYQDLAFPHKESIYEVRNCRGISLVAISSYSFHYIVGMCYKVIFILKISLQKGF